MIDFVFCVARSARQEEEEEEVQEEEAQGEERVSRTALIPSPVYLAKVLLLRANAPCPRLNLGEVLRVLCAPGDHIRDGAVERERFGGKAWMRRVRGMVVEPCVAAPLLGFNAATPSPA